MNLSYIHSEDLEAFGKRFPEAHEFLLRRTLLREFHHLCLVSDRLDISAQRKARLKELSVWYTNTIAMLVCPRCGHSDSSSDTQDRLTIRCNNCDTKYTEIEQYI